MNSLLNLLSKMLSRLLSRMLSKTLGNVVLLCGMQMAGLASADEFPFDRVFTTAEQRNTLNASRDYILAHSNFYEAQANAVQASEGKTSSLAPEKLKVSGLLLRGDGKSVMWLNGESKLSPNEILQNQGVVRGRALASNKVRLYYDDKYRTLKPGQVWLVDEGKVIEAHQVDALIKQQNEQEKLKGSASVNSSEEQNSMLQDDNSITQSLKQIQSHQQTGNKNVSE